VGEGWCALTGQRINVCVRLGFSFFLHRTRPVRKVSRQFEQDPPSLAYISVHISYKPLCTYLVLPNLHWGRISPTTSDLSVSGNREAGRPTATPMPTNPPSRRT